MTTITQEIYERLFHIARFSLAQAGHDCYPPNSDAAWDAAEYLGLFFGWDRATISKAVYATERRLDRHRPRR